MTGMSSFYFHISVYSNILHSTFTVCLKNKRTKDRNTWGALIN